MKAGEILGMMLLTLANVAYYQALMAGIRESILQDAFLPFYERMRGRLAITDEQNPPTYPKPAKPFHYPRLGDYEIHPGQGGFNSIRQISSGEVMHSVNRPDDEADQLYVAQSFLERRLVARRELSAVVEEAMALLPDEQRTAIILKEYHGMTFQEIADLQGCPLSTVKTRLYQGLSVLRKQLERQGQTVAQPVGRNSVKRP